MAAKKQPTKKWYESKTLWINGALGLLTVLEIVVASNLIPDPEYLALAIAVINILRRFRVTEPVKTLSR